MADKYPVVKVKLCSHLKDVKPGELDFSLLRGIEGKGKLHHCAADAYEAMDAAANKDGIDLSPTSQADTYRSLETQEYGFYARYTDKPKPKLMKQTPRIYKGKAWYLKKGLARLEWLLANAARFGFSWEVQSEPWHLRYVAGDETPKAVKDWLEEKSNQSDD